MVMGIRKAIKEKCRWCMGNHGKSLKCARECASKICPLMPYRPGQPPVPQRGKAVRDYCLMCMGTSLEVKNCQSQNCSLYRFRFGKGFGADGMSMERRMAAAERLRRYHTSKKENINGKSSA